MNIKDKIQKIIDDNISEMPLYIDYQKLADEIYQLVIDYNSYKHNEYLKYKEEEDYYHENCR